jgi:hypothetical protein
MSAFYRECQFIEFHPDELDRESAASLFATFRVPQLLVPKATKEERSAQNKAMRKQVDETARGYREMLIRSGMGRRKEGYTLDERPIETAFHSRT